MGGVAEGLRQTDDARLGSHAACRHQRQDRNSAACWNGPGPASISRMRTVTSGSGTRLGLQRMSQVECDAVTCDE